MCASVIEKQVLFLRWKTIKTRRSTANCNILRRTCPDSRASRISSSARWKALSEKSTADLLASATERSFEQPVSSSHGAASTAYEFARRR